MNTAALSISESTKKIPGSEGITWLNKAFKAAANSFFKTWGAIILIALIMIIPKLIIGKLISTSIAFILSIIFQHAFLIASTHSLQTTGQLHIGANLKKLATKSHHLLGAGLIVGIIGILGIYAFKFGHQSIVDFRHGEGLFGIWSVVILVLSWLTATCIGMFILSTYPYTLFLIMNRDKDFLEANFQSFSTCLSNFVPLLVLGLVFSLAAILATLPLFLGWFLLAPANYHLFSIVGGDLFGESSKN